MIRAIFFHSCIIFFGVFFMKSCADPKQRNNLQDLKWLAGSWESTSEIGFKENWNLTDKTKMNGVGYSIEGSDTLMFEHLEIFASDSGTFYRVLVLGQNEDLPVLFKLTHSEPDSFVFSNPSHDFPKLIVYRKLSEDLLRVHVRDGFGDGSRGFSLEMTKLTD